jgi:hypothetical protein
MINEHRTFVFSLYSPRSCLNGVSASVSNKVRRRVLRLHCQYKRCTPTNPSMSTLYISNNSRTLRYIALRIPSGAAVNIPIGHRDAKIKQLEQHSSRVEQKKTFYLSSRLVLKGLEHVSAIFWDVMPCSPVEFDRRFEESSATMFTVESSLRKQEASWAFSNLQYANRSIKT